MWRLRVRDRLKTAMREREDYVSSLRQWQKDGCGQRLLENMQQVQASLLVDRPEKIGTPDHPPVEELVFSPLIERVKAVTRQLTLVSAYFVPGELGMELLGDLTARGVRVRVLTNSLAATDLPLVHGGYTLYRQALLEAGVELHEMSSTASAFRRWRLPWRGKVSLHSKTIIFDDDSAFVGSFNMDPRSAFWNTEIGVLMDSPVLAAQLNQLAEQAMAPDISYRLQLSEKKRIQWQFLGPRGLQVRRVEKGSFWRRLLAWFSARMAPEGWL